MSFLFSDVAFGSGLRGFIPWQNQSFLWINRNYGDFADYLSDLNKNQRRNVRREWQSLEEQGLEIRVLTGADLTEGVMEVMYPVLSAHKCTVSVPGPPASLTGIFF